MMGDYEIQLSPLRQRLYHTGSKVYVTWIQINVVLMVLTQELDCETSFFFFVFVRTGIEI
jgi:hypothetical protein